MDAVFTPEQEARIREIVREMFPDIEQHIDRAISTTLYGARLNAGGKNINQVPAVTTTEGLGDLPSRMQSADSPVMKC